MNRFIIAIATAATLVASPAFATDPVKKVGTTDPMARKVCIVQPASTGTILSRKTCKSRADWISQTGIDPLKK
jgi:hypothetical protein